MVNIGIFYGSDTGATETVAKRIKKALGKKLNKRIENAAKTFDVNDVDDFDFAPYDLILMGIPTWYYGELQADWEDRWEKLEEYDFSDKIIALFGLGDQEDYGEYFLDAMGMLHDVVLNGGAEVIGYWPVEGYTFEESKAITEDGEFFVGLGIDEDRQDDLTDERIDVWLDQVLEDFLETRAAV